MFTFCCIAVLVVGFSLVLAMLINMGKIRAMQHAGVTVAGTIVRFAPRRVLGIQLGRPPSMTVTVRYTVEGRAYSTSLPITLADGTALIPGETIDLLYNPSKPDMVIPVFPDRRLLYIKYVHLALGIAFVITGIALIAIFRPF